MYVAALSSKLPLSQLSTGYQKFKANVDNLKLIQLGLSFCNERGEFPPVQAYQFNFQFDVANDLNVEKSIELLRSHNIDFERFRTDGINPIYFSYLLATSGLLNNPKLVWVFFHGSYDMGYITKAVTLHDLPLSQSEFIQLYQNLYPNLVDLKVVLKWESSLQSLMQSLSVERRGDAHQAGSDAYATVGCYLRVRGQKLDGKGKIYDIDDV